MRRTGRIIRARRLLDDTRTGPSLPRAPRRSCRAAPRARCPAAGGVVGDYRERRVFQADLARQRGFRHAGHADDIGAVALEPVDLGRGFEPRPLRRGVHAAVGHPLARGGRRIEQRARITRRYGSVKSMWLTGTPVLRRRSTAAPGVIDHLVRKQIAPGQMSLRMPPTEATDTTLSAPASLSAQRFAR